MILYAKKLIKIQIIRMNCRQSLFYEKSDCLREQQIMGAIIFFLFFQVLLLCLPD
jgi:hypothetical protein